MAVLPAWYEPHEKGPVWPSRGSEGTEGPRALGSAAVVDAAVASLKSGDLGAVLVVAEAGAGKADVADSIAGALEGEFAVVRLLASHALKGVRHGALLSILDSLEPADFLAPHGAANGSTANGSTANGSAANGRARAAGPDRGMAGHVAVLRSLWTMVDTKAREAGRPVLIVAEDMHHADEGTASALAEAVSSRWVKLVATARLRPGMPPGLLELWHDGLGERLELGPMDLAGSHAMAEAQLGGAVSRAAGAVLHHVSGGSPERLPLVIGEALGKGALVARRGIWVLASDFVSSGAALEQHVRADLDTLSPAQRSGLALIAHAQPLQEQSARALIPEHVLIELGERGWLADREDGFVRIRSALVADAIRLLTSIPRKLQIHQKLESLGEPWGPDRPNALGRIALALDVGAEVSDAQLAAGAELAVRESQNALALHCMRLISDEGIRSRLRGARARALFNRSDYSACLTSLLSGPRRKSDADDLLVGTLLLSHVRSVLGQAHANPGDADQLAAMARELPADFPPDRPDGPRHAVERRARLLKSMALAYGGDFHRALAADPAQGRAFDGGGEPAVERAIWSLMRAEADIVGGRFEGAMRSAGAVLARPIEDDEHYPLEGHALMRYLVAAIHVGSWEAVDSAVEAYGSGRTWPVVVCGPALYSAQAYALVRQERVDEALQVLPEIIECLRVGDPYKLLGLTLALAAYAAAAAGRTEEARTWLDEAEAAANVGRALTGWLARLHRIAAEVRLGVPDAAGRLVEFIETLRQDGHVGVEMAARSVALELDLEAGHGPDPLEAAELAPACEGRWTAAMGAWAGAIVSGKAEDLMQAGELLRELGILGRARRAFAKAAAAFDEAGDRANARLAGQAARRCEAPGSPAPADDPGEAVLASFQLTPREQDIVGLALDGLSDRQIAEKLHLSVRTVEGHLHRSYAKLGVASRAELAAAVED